MPVYEYQCQSCQEVIEAQQRIADAPLTTCPSCSGSLKKLISANSFQLKGSGWYADGYSGGKSCSTTGGDSSSCPAKQSSTCGGCC
ncbi:MAG: FmdB family zinc ribbon protein [Thermodesulfobacteriota bacterium]